MKDKVALIFIIGVTLVLIYTLLMPKVITKKTEKSADSFINVQQEYESLSSREDLDVATFAGGCFWCMEGPYEAEEGVEEVISGYTGGNVEDPTYEDVNTDKTGHREGIQVFFNPEIVSYDRLVEIYWWQIDPTDDGGQFSDRGYQYTTAIYYHNDEQKKIAEDSKLKQGESDLYDAPIVTEIIPFKNFYPAEDYHQDFYKNSEERYKTYENLSGRKGYRDQIKEKLKL